MPGLDQRGPTGEGPMTGWKTGRCTNFGEKIRGRAAREKEDIDTNQGDVFPEDLPPGGYGFGAGYGRGRGLGRGRASRGPGRGLGRQNRFRGGF